MPYKDALQDTVTINSVSTNFKVGDSIGETVKTKVALYSNIKGRLYSMSSGESFNRKEVGKQEKFKYVFGLQLEGQYNGAERGDEAIVNGKTYLIIKKQELRGTSSIIHHVIYHLEEGL